MKRTDVRHISLNLRGEGARSLFQHLLTLPQVGFQEVRNENRKDDFHLEVIREVTATAGPAGRRQEIVGSFHDCNGALVTVGLSA
jgi:hypothetical protein